MVDHRRIINELDVSHDNSIREFFNRSTATSRRTLRPGINSVPFTEAEYLRNMKGEVCDRCGGGVYNTDAVVMNTLCVRCTSEMSNDGPFITHFPRENRLTLQHVIYESSAETLDYAGRRPPQAVDLSNLSTYAWGDTSTPAGEIPRLTDIAQRLTLTQDNVVQ